MEKNYTVPLIEGGATEEDFLAFAMDLLRFIQVSGAILITLGFLIAIVLTKHSTISMRRIWGITALITAILGIVLLMKSHDLLAFLIPLIIP